VAKTVTALIVDDDRAMQRLLADTLTHEGFSVCVEKDGEWALKTFQKRSIQVVVLDVLLPAVNGYEVARKLRLTPKGQDVPLIFISGVYRAPAQRKDAIERYRAVDFLEKPFKLPALREALRKALGADYPDPQAAEAERERIEHTDAGVFADRAATEEAKQVEAEARNQPSAQLPALRGSLAGKPFPELLSEIYRWRADGALLLRRDKVKKIVYFRGGVPFFVKSNLLSECLGKILVREKMISEPECEESLRRMKTTRRQQGTVLIDMGCISPPNLQYALNLQLQAKLFDIFSWQDGDYQLNPKAELPPEATSLEMTTAAVIYEGLKRTWSLDAIHMAMAPHQADFVHPAADPLYRFQDAGLDEEELAVLAAADGRKSVKTLAALGLLPPIDTLRLLLAMRFSQMVNFRDEAAATAERALPKRPEAVPWDTPTGPLTAPHLQAAPAIPNALPAEFYAPNPPFGDDDDREATVVDRQAYVPSGGAPFTDEVPALTGEAPVLTGEVPALTGEVPAVTAPMPRLTGEVPRLTGEVPRPTGEVQDLTAPLPRIDTQGLGGTTDEVEVDTSEVTRALEQIDRDDHLPPPVEDEPPEPPPEARAHTPRRSGARRIASRDKLPASRGAAAGSDDDRRAESPRPEDVSSNRRRFGAAPPPSAASEDPGAASAAESDSSTRTDRGHSRAKLATAAKAAASKRRRHGVDDDPPEPPKAPEVRPAAKHSKTGTSRGTAGHAAAPAPAAKFPRATARRPNPPPTPPQPPEFPTQVAPPPLPKRPKIVGPPPPAPVNLHQRAAGSLLPELSAVISLHLSPEERAQRERLAATAVALKKKDYFEMLGVAPNAKPEDVKAAYFVMAKQYHPDRAYRSASAEVRSLANDIYQLLSSAYETLKDPDDREQYVADLAKGIKKDVSDEVSKILAAEGKFQRGEELIRKRQYKEAHQAFQEAVGLYAQEGEFHAFLGWAHFQTDPRNPDTARAAMDEIERAIRLNPKVDKSYLFLGYIFKATGRPDKAEQQFERAIQCNPDCTEALRELRLLGKSRR